MKWRLECLVIGFLIVAVVAIAQQMFEFGSGQFQQAPATMLASQKQELTVTDGDPVHVIGEAAGTMLVGFNTPEKFLPGCDYERQQGERASARLMEQVAQANTRLTKVD